jgi:hypothetical protein
VDEFLQSTPLNKETMADDPNRKHLDGWFNSNLPHEYENFKAAMKQSHPDKTDDDVAQAILFCRSALAPYEGRAKLMRYVDERLRGY